MPTFITKSNTTADIFQEGRMPAEIIADLEYKTIEVPAWADLRKDYDPKQHAVFTDKSYTDKVKHGRIEKMTRIAYPVEKQSVKRMKELMFTIPVKRKYTTANEQEQEAASIMEAVFKKNHIDSLNIKRAHKLFASCEVATIWYTQEADTMYAGRKSSVKLRCRVFSPMDGDSLYPRFDEYDDMIALSIKYQRIIANHTITYFDSYTAEYHYRFINDGSGWRQDIEPEPISIQKIQGVYMYRSEPIWEDQSTNRNELEWTQSRNGNYLRKNSRPTWVIYSNNPSPVGKNREPSDDNSGRNILRYGQNDKAGYATWSQAVDALKFHTEELRRNIHTSLQLPDMSMEQMKATPMSGEARKMLFIDCQMKVSDEKGDWLEFFDREVNVVRAFLAEIFPDLADAFMSIGVENEITAFQIDDYSQQIKDLTDATGGKSIMSQRTAVRRLGAVPEEAVDDELQAIEDDESSTEDVFTNEPAI